ncbi:hypothetical protein ACSBR2_007196 [Camellia fascicularis]
MGSELVTDVMAERIHDKPLTHPTNVSYRVAWLGVKKVKGEIFSDHSTSFYQLWWYSNAVIEYNLGSYFNLDFDTSNTRRFNRLFISFKAYIDGFNQCRPLLFLDGTFLKGRFKGNLLATTAKDGNTGYAVIYSGVRICRFGECIKLGMVFTSLANIVDGSRSLTFVSDRHIGLLESIPVIFLTSHHAFYMQHLQRNLRDKIKYINNPYRIGMVSKFHKCAYAPTVSDFNQKGNRYREMSSNVAESFNNWIKEA